MTPHQVTPTVCIKAGEFNQRTFKRQAICQQSAEQANSHAEGPVPSDPNLKLAGGWEDWLTNYARHGFTSEITQVVA